MTGTSGANPPAQVVGVEVRPGDEVLPFGSTSYVDLPAVVVGTVVALAVSVVLLTFGSGVGLSAVSPWTTSPTTVTVVSLGAGFWLLLVNVWAFGLGGYLTGRMRHRVRGAAPVEVAFRDGAHGLAMWGLALTVAAVVAALSAALARTETPGPVDMAARTAADVMLRPALPAIAPPPAAAGEDPRPAIVAMLTRAATSPTPDALTVADRTYLAGLVTQRTQLAAPDAEGRVNAALLQVRAAATRARRTGVMLAFVTAAGLLLGGAAAWWGASVGGRHRDEGTVWEGLGGRVAWTSLRRGGA